MDIFLSWSSSFWLGVSAWLLWMMSIWLLMDPSVLPGRQSCLNCCMPLERASLMGLLESQSVSAAFSLSRYYLGLNEQGSLDDATNRFGLVTLLRRLWPRGMISLSCLFQADWCQTGIQQRWRFMLMSAGAVFVFVAWLVLWNNGCDEIWQPCTQTVTETNFSDCDNLIQAGCAENLFWCDFRKASMGGDGGVCDAIIDAAIL